MARIDDWQRLWEKTVEIESEITKIALAGTALVPRPGDLTELLGLGRKLERISKGRNILLFDKLGRPGIFVVFPCDFKARQEYLSDNNRIFETKTDGAGYYCDLHPAFIVNKKGISRLLVGKYQCGAYRTSSGGRENVPVSLYGLDPAYAYNTHMFAGLESTNNGSVQYGHKIGSMTLATWGYLGLLQVREGFVSRGNTNYGRSHKKTDEVGDKGGYFAGHGNFWHIKCGTGPVTWRHDGTPFGVSDLCGNVAEEVAGFRTLNGELQFIPDNDALDLDGADISSGTSEYWKAMVEDSAESLYVAPGTSGTIKMDFIEAETESNRSDRAGHLCKTVVNQQTVNSYSMSQTLASLAHTDDLTVPKALQMFLLAPLDEDTPEGRLYYRNFAGQDYRNRRGGGPASGSSGGPSGGIVYSGPSSGIADYGSRLCSFDW